MSRMSFSQEVSSKRTASCVLPIANGLITGDNGSMSFWDWKTGHRFQSLDTTAQPGSLDAEAGIMSSTFDRSGLRLICGEADKTSELPLSTKLSNVTNNYSQNMEAG